jgi:DNA-binding HxlR family transcriptional regulator
VRRTRFNEAPCPIARTTDLVGDWWTPILLREAFLGRRRFEDFHRSLGLSRAILARRLDRLVREGLMVKQPYEERPRRYEYRLTAKGRAFFDVLAAMWRWGSDWLWPEGKPPLALIDRQTGLPIEPVVVDGNTGLPIDVRRLTLAAAQGRRQS